jgi:hypothetical protein
VVVVSGTMQQSAATTTSADGSYTLLNLLANGMPYTVSVKHGDQMHSKNITAPLLPSSIQYLDFGSFALMLYSFIV